jgi:hypothetical protein
MSDNEESQPLMTLQRDRPSSTSPRGRRIRSRKWGMVALWRTGMDALYIEMVGSNDSKPQMRRSRS